MAFPRKLLAPGEEIVLEAHPNWSILVPRVAWFVLIVAGCLSVIVLWTHAPLWAGWVLLGIAAAFLLWLLAKIVVWRSTTLVLTTLRVVYRTGALRRLGREIPLDRVQDVTYNQSILERIVGAGSLTIESAGSHGDDPFPDIRHPALVQSLINRLIAQPSGGLGSPGGGLGGRGGGSYRPQAPPQSEPPYQQPQYAPPPSPYRSPPHDEQPLTQYEQPPQYRPQPPLEPVGDLAPPSKVPGTAGTVSASSSEQLQRLDELHRLGVITDAEYAQKRQELIQGR
jgi:membrane protein YdbS with pleckstrin-like domain